jgi:hypothetical protein
MAKPRRKVSVRTASAIAAALALVALLVVVLGHRARRPPALADGPGDAGGRSPAGGGARALPSLPVETAVDGLAPVIDEIAVEKPEICSGEENLVSVRAHTRDGTDAHLHYRLSGGGPGAGGGALAPVRVWLRPDGGYELPVVLVFGKNNVVARGEIPRFRVKECGPRPGAVITARLLPNSWNEYELHASLVTVTAEGDRPPPAISPRRFAWSFGDGQTATTGTGTVSHRFRGGGEDALYSSYLVAVEIALPSGDPVRARLSLEVLNVAFENLDQRGIVTLVAEPEPRFPVLDGDGVVRQTFRLWHHHRSAVRVTRVTATRNLLPPPGGGPPPPAVTTDVDAGPALGLDVVAPGGGGVPVAVALDTRREGEIFAVTYAVEGRTDDGLPARGSFSILRPPPPPTRETSRPIADPALRDKVRRAIALLGKPVVNDEDLWRLEREGRLGAPAAPPAEGAEVAPRAPAARHEPGGAAGRRIDRRAL